eukprot:3721681-Amphidinium_carterae.1
MMTLPYPGSTTLPSSSVVDEYPPTAVSLAAPPHATGASFALPATSKQQAILIWKTVMVVMAVTLQQPPHLKLYRMFAALVHRQSPADLQALAVVAPLEQRGCETFQRQRWQLHSQPTAARGHSP